MTTPPTNRPMTGEDVHERVVEIVREKFYGGPVSGASKRLADALVAEFPLIYSYRVSRPAPEPERDGAVERAKRQIELGKKTGADAGGKSPHNIYVIAAELLSLLEEARANVVQLGDALRQAGVNLETAERQRDEAVRALCSARTDLAEIVTRDIHHEGFDLDSDEMPPEGAISRTWLGDLGQVARKARNDIDQALQSIGGDR